MSEICQTKGDVLKLHTLIRKQTLPVDINRAWEFFGDPSKLAEITPPWLGFKVRTELPPETYAGMVVRYTITPFGGIPVQWITEITHAEKPFFFVDEQRFGPYKFWHHQHIFRETDSGTEMTDIVDYILPFGFLGELAHMFYVKRKLDEIFTYRKETLDKNFS